MTYRLVCSLTSALLLLGIATAGFTIHPAANQMQATYSAHGPIQILSDGDFTPANGVVSGTGSAGDPYIISGWNITAESYGIRIHDTTAYFQVAGNYISNTTAPCIEVSNVAQYTCGICENEVYYSGNDGIKVMETDGAHIDHNFVRFSNYSGIVLMGCNGVTVLSNEVTENNQKLGGGHAGIYVDQSNGNSIVDNEVYKNSPHYAPGIWLIRWCNGNFVEANTVWNNAVGIQLDEECTSNTLVGNSVWNSTTGLALLWRSNGNTIAANNVTHTGCGISTRNSTGNSVVHNNFFDNVVDHYIDNASTVWDLGYPFGGNYWGAYGGADAYWGPAQDLLGSDGIGDDAYVLDLDNVDHYPLMNPWPDESIRVSWNQLEVPRQVRDGEAAPVVACIGLHDWYDSAAVALGYRVDGGDWWNTTMARQASFGERYPGISLFTLEIPGHPAGSWVEFYVESEGHFSLLYGYLVREVLTGDLTGDDVVDIFDLVIVALAFGDTYP